MNTYALSTQLDQILTLCQTSLRFTLEKKYITDIVEALYLFEHYFLLFFFLCSLEQNILTLEFTLPSQYFYTLAVNVFLNNTAALNITLNIYPFINCFLICYFIQIYPFLYVVLNFFLLNE
jgi:hypothetical protein